MYDNKKIIILSPIVLAAVLIVGMFLGNLFGGRSKSTNLARMQGNKIDAILELIDEDYVDTVNREKLIESAIPKLLEQLDPHSVYISAADVSTENEPLEGSFEGIGVEFNMEKDTILVVNVIAGGPSFKKGILAGDRIISINDTVVAGKKLKSDNVVKKLKGQKGTKVKVGIERNHKKELIYFDIERGKIPIYSIDAAYMLNNEIGYIKITRFAQTTHDEFVEAIKKLKKQGLKKIILDLRENGGGYLDAAVKIADEFLPDKKMIVYTQGKSHPRSNYYATSKDLCVDYPLALLIDEWSASASEILAGAIQDNDRGTIVGRRSFGKGLVQEPIAFKDGSAIRLTIARYYTPTGRCIQKPYNKGLSEYQKDISKRALRKEMEVKDSIKTDTSKKFKTPKGKIVFGGGGIMPDIFVPRDTAGLTAYYTKIYEKGLLTRFALNYADSHRDVLKKFKKATDFETYLDKENVFTKFIDYATKNGIARNDHDIAISHQIIDVQLKALIARNIISDADGFYPIIRRIDLGLQKAIDLFSKK